MKWIKNDPSIGDARTINKFAWRPTTMTDGETVVWLEWYQVRQKYGLTGYTDPSFKWMLVERLVPPPLISKSLTEGSMKANIKNYNGNTAPMAAPPPAPCPPIKIIKCPDHWE